MQISGIPFEITDWSQVERTEHKGASGMAYWRTQNFGALRLRMVEYTPGYLADHWCVKGTYSCAPKESSRLNFETAGSSHSDPA